MTAPVRRTLVLAGTTALAVLAALLPAPAGAQDAGSEAGATGPTVSLPEPPTTAAPTTTTLPPAPEDPGRDSDAPPEDVPVVEDTVPPPAGADGAQAAQLVHGELRVAKADLLAATAGVAQAERAVWDLTVGLSDLRDRIGRLGRAKSRAIRDHARAKEQLEQRAADALIRGDMGGLALIIGAKTPNEVGQRHVLMGSVLDEDDRVADEYLRAQRRLSRELRVAADDLTTMTTQLATAQEILDEAYRQRDMAAISVAVFGAGSEFVIHGFVFPVDDPHSFWDSFGAPRMTGTEYEHAHRGTDIMAPAGTKLLACERGIITRMGTDVLGGTTLWVKGESGTYYYYAHLSAYEDGIVDGTVVDAGDVVGYVGDTGNAKGGAPHLHFQIHPDGGEPVNPYPLLKVADALRKLRHSEQPS
jgi:murein DD-endopeptidase MepM/ murein hydrolase activator NlpD